MRGFAIAMAVLLAANVFFVLYLLRRPRETGPSRRGLLKQHHAADKIFDAMIYRRNSLVSNDPDILSETTRIEIIEWRNESAKLFK